MVMNPPSIINSTARREFGNPVIQIILLLVVLTLVSWFVIKPQWTKTSQLRADLKTAQKKMSKVEEDQQEMNKLIAELNASPQEVAIVDEALPLSGRVSKAYVLLDNLVRFSGMSSVLLSADDTSEVIAAGNKDVLNNPYEPGRELHTITMSVSVSGSMEQFKTLLETIETNGRVLDVETVNILGEDSEARFRITVKAYSYEKL